jgi:hypothetical protein
MDLELDYIVGRGLSCVHAISTRLKTEALTWLGVMDGLAKAGSGHCK